MLRVEGISVYYGEFQALDTVSIEVKQGQTVIVVGSNGSGKSTLLRAIAGLSKLHSGQISFQDKPIGKEDCHEIVDAGITLVPEGGRLFPSLTVYENLKAGAYTKRARAYFRESLEEILTLFPVLRERNKQVAGSLSGGERQMLAIARSLMSKPKLVMLDEPSLGLAPRIVGRVFDFVGHLKENGYSVLVVEQNAKKALALADYAYLLEAGRLIFEGGKEEFDKNPYIKKAYLGL